MRRLPARTVWTDRGSSYPFSAGLSVHKRHDADLEGHFADLCEEAQKIIPGLAKTDLVVDIRSDDETLLSNFLKAGYPVQGIELSDKGELANERGITTLISYFNEKAVSPVLQSRGKVRVITATNVFAHIENVHNVAQLIENLLTGDGVFTSESHYLLPLVETLRYDTVYHEHLRCYSLTSLKFLLESHGFDIFYAKWIPTHGGSIRVCAAKKAGSPSIRP